MNAHADLVKIVDDIAQQPVSNPIESPWRTPNRVKWTFDLVINQLVFFPISKELVDPSEALLKAAVIELARSGFVREARSYAQQYNDLMVRLSDYENLKQN